jgi:hypothetical protein
VIRGALASVATTTTDATLHLERDGMLAAPQ